tara:strand:+ start:47682 stop:48092 length:411 start_codon:yes stop_codon:yes gene_type:complete
MRLLTRIPYEEVDFVWISNHWDMHLSGLCRYNKKLCYFDNVDDIYDNKLKDIYVSIHNLIFDEKIEWIIRKKLFEWCVGYHWTYPHRESGVHYRKRSPRWFWQFIQDAYYRVTMRRAGYVNYRRKYPQKKKVESAL